MVNALNGLRHNAVVGSNNEYCDIGDHCAARTHGCKCLMARSIQEGYGTAVDFNGICADMLGYAARLTGCNVCMADIVKQ